LGGVVDDAPSPNEREADDCEEPQPVCKADGGVVLEGGAVDDEDDGTGPCPGSTPGTKRRDGKTILNTLSSPGVAEETLLGNSAHSHADTSARSAGALRADPHTQAAAPEWGNSYRRTVLSGPRVRDTAARPPGVSGAVLAHALEVVTSSEAPGPPNVTSLTGPLCPRGRPGGADAGEAGRP
jgi:hypothetical protein